jgi:hypothetical protein
MQIWSAWWLPSMYGDFSKRTSKNEFWTCVYFIQTSEKPYLVKVGKSKTPMKRMADLQVGCSGRLSMIWYMRSIWFGEVILQKAFEGHLEHGEWYRPHDRFKGFVRHCKANNLRVLTPDVLDDVLPKYACSGDFRSFTGEYRTLFESEYPMIAGRLKTGTCV